MRIEKKMPNYEIEKFRVKKRKLKLKKKKEQIKKV